MHAVTASWQTDAHTHIHIYKHSGRQSYKGKGSSQCARQIYVLRRGLWFWPGQALYPIDAAAVDPVDRRHIQNRMQKTISEAIYSRHCSAHNSDRSRTLGGRILSHRFDTMLVSATFFRTWFVTFKASSGFCAHRSYLPVSMIFSIISHFFHNLS